MRMSSVPYFRTRYCWAENGRGKGIRTPDILLPKQARYQTALYPADLDPSIRPLGHPSRQGAEW